MRQPSWSAPSSPTPDRYDSTRCRGCRRAHRTEATWGAGCHHSRGCCRGAPYRSGRPGAGPTGLSSTGSGSIVGANTSCDNDLPKWYNPATGATSTASASPGTGWFRFPFQRTYTVEQYADDLATRVVAPATYAVKKVTVTVRATTGPFPGLRQTQQSVLVRFRDAG